MAGLVEKTYGDALFELILEESPAKLTEAKAELDAVDSIIKDIPELIKLSKTPTVSKEEKLGLIEEAFKERCNDHLGIAEITVITCEPLTAKAKADLSAKMEKMLGKKIVMKEELDRSIIGGIVVKNGNTTLDGSVKAKLRALRTDIGSVIC